MAEKSPEPDPQEAPTPEPTATPPPVVAVQPAPVADPLAPAGVYFLLTKASVTTDDSIVGIVPGTRLQMNGPGEYTDAAGHVLKLQEKQVTNNLRLAGLAAQADAKAQAAVRQAMAQAAAQPATPAPSLVTPAPRAVANGAPAAQFSATSMAAPSKHAEKSSSSGGMDMAPASIQNDRRYMDSSGYWHVKDAKGNWQYEK